MTKMCLIPRSLSVRTERTVQIVLREWGGVRGGASGFKQLVQTQDCSCHSLLVLPTIAGAGLGGRESRD